jgi:hypothetical protein
MEAARTESAVLTPVFRDGAGDLRLVLVIRQKRDIHGGSLRVIDPVLPYLLADESPI